MSARGSGAGARRVNGAERRSVDPAGLYVFLCAIHDGLNARQSDAATAVLQRYAADVEARP